jgi:hypothetical protein
MDTWAKRGFFFSSMPSRPADRRVACKTKASAEADALIDYLAGLWAIPNRTNHDAIAAFPEERAGRVTMPAHGSMAIVITGPVVGMTMMMMAIRVTVTVLMAKSGECRWREHQSRGNSR